VDGRSLINREATTRLGISFGISFVSVVARSDERRRLLMKFVNEASWDRIARVVLGVALLGLGWTGAVSGTLGTIFKIVGFIPLITGLVGWCPLYAIFRFRTNEEPARVTEAV
jgi:hypothetical protein